MRARAPTFAVFEDRSWVASNQLCIRCKRSKVNKRMSRAATIETPFPSLEDTAHVLGVSMSEAKRVRRLLTLANRVGRSKARSASRRKYAAKKKKV